MKGQNDGSGKIIMWDYATGQFIAKDPNDVVPKAGVVPCEDTYHIHADEGVYYYKNGELVHFSKYTKDN